MRNDDSKCKPTSSYNHANIEKMVKKRNDMIFTLDSNFNVVNQGIRIHVYDMRFTSNVKF